jgi:hypothetical protein
VPGKKSPAGDKAAVRVDGISSALSSDRLPLLAEQLDGEEDLRAQASAWIEAVASDAVAIADDDA